MLPLLRAHREAQAAERARAGHLWEEHDLVFATRHGRPMERSEDYKAWKALLKRAGVRDARLHDARHTAGTLLVEQGVHIRVVQEILGHARVTTTERYTMWPVLSCRTRARAWGPLSGATGEGRAATATRAATLTGFGDQKGPLSIFERGPFICGGSGI
ncbi:tyrosine-type recombinase/integrase [Streptosporangium carneum]|uniref:Tyr recombinase domain-containing protein n=1 Tax=Streptosporangium carneum TaxID=47481 RepID=A0A9W6HXJ2_9ACTN|nr:tyrosine-type recombinase/integrase [Streptosporangium carneum]GLK07220.1 hypothetical protein GCM10017600_06250 [Streptosporangium carneum]